MFAKAKALIVASSVVLTVAQFAVTAGSAAVIGGVDINEIYGGGGNTGAPYTNDYVELYNNSLSPVDISGYVVKYSSSSGTGTFSNTVGTVPASTTLAPLSFYVITAGPTGAVGVAVPNANLAGVAGTNLSATSGEVELLASATSTTALDEVGYGTAKLFEGLAAAGTGSNTTAIQRVVDGVDTDQNSVDFIVAAPTPGTTNVVGGGGTVPEPATLSVVGLTGLAMLGRRR